MSEFDAKRELTPIEQDLKNFQKEGETQKIAESEEIVDYLMYTVRLARKKTGSKKLPDLTKVRWVKAGVDASKILLFSGVLDRREKRDVQSFQAFFVSLMKEGQLSVEAKNSHYTHSDVL